MAKAKLEAENKALIQDRARQEAEHLLEAATAARAQADAATSALAAERAQVDRAAREHEVMTARQMGWNRPSAIVVMRWGQ